VGSIDRSVGSVDRSVGSIDRSMDQDRSSRSIHRPDGSTSGVGEPSTSKDIIDRPRGRSIDRSIIGWRFPDGVDPSTGRARARASASAEPSRETSTRGVDSREWSREWSRESSRPSSSRRRASRVVEREAVVEFVSLFERRGRARGGRARGASGAGEKARGRPSEGTRGNGDEAWTGAMSASVGRPGVVMALEDGWGFMQVRRARRGAARRGGFVSFVSGRDRGLTRE